MDDKDLRRGMLEAGVRNLRNFGYPPVTRENILTDHLYRSFFKKMLEDKSNIKAALQSERVRKSLLAEVAAHDPDPKTKKRAKKK